MKAATSIIFIIIHKDNNNNNNDTIISKQGFLLSLSLFSLYLNKQKKSNEGSVIIYIALSLSLPSTRRSSRSYEVEQSTNSQTTHTSIYICIFIQDTDGVHCSRIIETHRPENEMAKHQRKPKNTHTLRLIYPPIQQQQSPHNRHTNYHFILYPHPHNSFPSHHTRGICIHPSIDPFLHASTDTIPSFLLSSIIIAPRSSSNRIETVSRRRRRQSNQSPRRQKRTTARDLLPTKPRNNTKNKTKTKQTERTTRTPVLSTTITTFIILLLLISSHR